MGTSKGWKASLPSVQECSPTLEVSVKNSTRWWYCYDVPGITAWPARSLWALSKLLTSLCLSWLCHEGGIRMLLKAGKSVNAPKALRQPLFWSHLLPFLSFVVHMVLDNLDFHYIHIIKCWRTCVSSSTGNVLRNVDTYPWLIFLYFRTSCGSRGIG